jgi:hypothetical protein
VFARQEKVKGFYLGRQNYRTLPKITMIILIVSSICQTINLVFTKGPAFTASLEKRAKSQASQRQIRKMATDSTTLEKDISKEMSK